MRTALQLFVVLGLASCVVGSPTVVEEHNIDGVYVYALDREPGFIKEALGSGAAEVHGDCLFVGKSIVIWRPAQLGFVEDLVESVARGERPFVELGGGSSDVDPERHASMLRRCDVDSVWTAGNGETIVAATP